jgi:ABC-type glycerol-3-phosphate transport system permease component
MSEAQSPELQIRVPGRKPRRPIRRSLATMTRHTFLILATLSVLLPLYFVVITSLKSMDNYSLDKFGFPKPIFTENFQIALRGGRYFDWFKNSIILSLGAVLVSAVVSSMGAFAFARMKFRFRDTLLAAVTALMIIPPVVMLIPLFLLLTRLDMTSTYWGAILVYAALITPFSVYLLTNFFLTIPFEIVESALLDGASSFDILVKILLPLAAPAIVTMVVVNMLWVWNDLLIALVLLPQDDTRTLMVGVTIFGSRYNRDVPIAMAGMLMASIPMILVYLVGQRYFIQGLVAGAVKG